MAPTPLRDRVGTERIEEIDTDQVRSVFQNDSGVGRLVEARFSKFSTGEMAAAGATLALTFVLGFVIGGGVSSPEPAHAVPADGGGLFISQGEADRYQQMETELEETRGQLEIAEGEPAFLQSRVDSLVEDAAQLRGARNKARLEMSLVMSIYEVCVEQLHPLDCIENARTEADAFLTELYADQS